MTNTNIAYRIRVGNWTSKVRRPFMEAEMLQKKLINCFEEVFIIAERE